MTVSMDFCPLICLMIKIVLRVSRINDTDAANCGPFISKPFGFYFILKSSDRNYEYSFCNEKGFLNRKWHTQHQWKVEQLKVMQPYHSHFNNCFV